MTNTLTQIISAKLAQLGRWLVLKFDKDAWPTHGTCEVYVQLYAGESPAEAKAIWEKATEGRVELLVNGTLRGWKGKAI